MTIKRIVIYRDGLFAGSGKYNDHTGKITDCGAVFSDIDDESERVYGLIEDAIQAGENHKNIETEDGLEYLAVFELTEID